MPPAAQKQPRHTNRLIHETSPYLLQHAHNPVDWYPWGQEAFDKARARDKPIFLSVGYSTCYWCHVMERQCFENEQIAREMNQRFINIKVDREERPDVHQLYMTAVQVLTHRGGWPMSVFLTPALEPFYAGTYFPPTDSPGQAGFLTVLRAIEDTYRNRRADVQQSCQQLMTILKELAEPQAPRRRSPSDATSSMSWSIARWPTTTRPLAGSAQRPSSRGRRSWRCCWSMPTDCSRPRPSRQSLQRRLRIAAQDPGHAPAHARCHGRGRHPRPSRRRLPSLLDRCAVARAAL